MTFSLTQPVTPLHARSLANACAFHTPLPLSGRLKRLQSELKSTRLDLKLVELNGKTWDQQLEVPGLEDAIGRGSGRGKGDADGELEYFSSRDEQVVTKST